MPHTRPSMDDAHPAARDLARHLLALHATTRRLYALAQPASRAQVGVWAPHGAHPPMPVVEATPHAHLASAHQRLEWDALIADAHAHLQGLQDAQDALPALQGTGLSWFFFGTIGEDAQHVQMHVERRTTHGADAIDAAILGLCSLLGHLPHHQGHVYAWQKGEESLSYLPAADAPSALLLATALTHHGDWSPKAVADALRGQPRLTHHVPLSPSLRAAADALHRRIHPVPG